MLHILANKQAKPVLLKHTFSLPLVLFLAKNGNVMFIVKEANCKVTTLKRVAHTYSRCCCRCCLWV